MPTDIKIEIKCTKNKEGSYSAYTLQDGALLTGYDVNRGSCNDIRALYQKVLNTYGGNSIEIGGACSECLAKE